MQKENKKQENLMHGIVKIGAGTNSYQSYPGRDRPGFFVE